MAFYQLKYKGCKIWAAKSSSKDGERILCAQDWKTSKQSFQKELFTFFIKRTGYELPKFAI